MRRRSFLCIPCLLLAVGAAPVKSIPPGSPPAEEVVARTLAAYRSVEHDADEGESTVAGGFSDAPAPAVETRFSTVFRRGGLFFTESRTRLRSGGPDGGETSIDFRVWSDDAGTVVVDGRGSPRAVDHPLGALIGEGTPAGFSVMLVPPLLDPDRFGSVDSLLATPGPRMLKVAEADGGPCWVLELPAAIGLRLHLAQASGLILRMETPAPYAGVK